MGHSCREEGLMALLMVVRRIDASLWRVTYVPIDCSVLRGDQLPLE
jgi:hypothetical protein